MEVSKIDNLTGVRALAAAWVLLVHLKPDASDMTTPFRFLFVTGSWGVWIFFVLSGYILAYVHGAEFENGIKFGDYARFLWKRLARIYPVHIFCLAIIVLFLFPLHLQWPSIYDGKTTFGLNLLLMHAWGFPYAAHVNYNLPSWSISTEWSAYLLFPFFVLIIFKLPRVTVAGVLILAAWGNLVVATITGIENFLHGTYVAVCLLLFTVGICSYRLSQKWRTHWAWHIASTSALIGMAILAWVAVNYNARGSQQWALPMLTAVLIVGLAKSGYNPLFGNRVVRYLGEISFSFYMTHVMVLLSLRNAFGTVPMLVEALSALAVAIFVYHGVEVPARDAMRKLIERRTSRAIDTRTVAVG